MAFGLETEQWEQIRRVLLNSDRIEVALLFGSRAKGNFKPYSDIDLALEGNNLTLQDVLELHLALDELELPYKFDLVILNRIEKAALKEHIARVGIPVFNRLKQENSAA